MVAVEPPLRVHRLRAWSAEGHRAMAILSPVLLTIATAQRSRPKSALSQYATSARTGEPRLIPTCMSHVVGQ